MRMCTKNSKKIIKKLIGVVAAVIVLMAAVVAIILFHFIRKLSHTSLLKFNIKLLENISHFHLKYKFKIIFD